MKKILATTILTFCFQYYFAFCIFNCDKDLIWSNRSANKMNWNSAVQYCKNLTEGQRSWRLPTIDELRTIIRNCSKTEKDGKCKITEKCLSLDCMKEDTCYCKYKNHNYYSKLDSNDGWLWSSSVPSGSSYDAWGIDFVDASIEKKTMDSLNYVRCVTMPE